MSKTLEPVHYQNTTDKAQELNIYKIVIVEFNGKNKTGKWHLDSCNSPEYEAEFHQNLKEKFLG